MNVIEEINVKGNKLYIMPHEKRLFENQVCCDDCMCEELNGDYDLEELNYKLLD